jgi:hypothetical protein
MDQKLQSLLKKCLHKLFTYSILTHLMPIKKKLSKKQKQESELEYIPETYKEESVQSNPRKIFTIKNILLLAILIIALLVWKNKGYFIAATVNGQPVSKWQLNNQLEKRFGSQVLDSIINERLILSAARQKGIFVTSDDIDKKMKQVEEQIKGQISLDDALKAQGLTKEDFKKQVEIQLSIDKMFDKESTVSTKDVDDYIAKNNSIAKNATNPAALKQEIQDMLKQQKVADLFNTWFTEVRKNAKIQRFL